MPSIQNKRTDSTGEREGFENRELFEYRDNFSKLREKSTSVIFRNLKENRATSVASQNLEKNPPKDRGIAIFILITSDYSNSDW